MNQEDILYFWGNDTIMERPKIERLLLLVMLMSSKSDHTVEDIAQRLDITSRSVYRYIETLRKVGFAVDKRQSNLYKLVKIPGISIDFDKLIYFSEEEAYILNSLINGLDGTNSIKRGLQKKLSAIYDLTNLADIVIDKSIAQNVESLGNAIRSKKKVILKNYESAHSDTISDRTVEPFCFTTNYIDIWAYDLEKHENKVYKISRIDSVQIMQEYWENESAHNRPSADCFRMSGNKSIPIKLELSLRAKNLLLEEYPLAAKYLREEGNLWILETNVHDLAGVGRFVIGLAAEIRIISSPELEEYVQNYALEHIINRKRDPEAPL